MTPLLFEKKTVAKETGSKERESTILIFFDCAEALKNPKKKIIIFLYFTF